MVERAAIGGQAGTSSLIRNYFGFSRGLSGAELAQRGYQQAWVFGARFLLTRQVEHLARDGHHFVAQVDQVGEVRARAVIISSGVSYQRLGLTSLEKLNGKGVYYGASVTAAQALERPARRRGRCRQLGGTGRLAPGEVLRVSAPARSWT